MSELQQRKTQLGGLRAGVAALDGESPLLATIDAQLQQLADYEGTLEAPELAEFEGEEAIKAYPDPHSKWDRIVVPASVTTVEEMVKFLEEQHSLKVDRWSIETPSGRGVTLYPVSTMDLSLLPAFDMSKGQAMMALQKDKRVPRSEMMKFLSKWEELKNSGGAAAAGAAAGGAAPGGKDATLATLLETKGELKLAGRKMLLLNGISFEDQDSAHVVAANIILEIGAGAQ